MDGKNDELARMKKSLEEKPANEVADNSQETSSSTPKVSTEAPVVKAKGGGKWSEAELQKFLAAAPDAKSFDDKFINEPVKAQLAIFNNPNSTEAEKAQAKDKINEVYKLRDSREEIQKLLYPHKLAEKKVPKNITPPTAQPSSPTGGVDMTPTPDVQASEMPKLSGNLDDMSKLSAGKSLEDINNTERNVSGAAKIEQAWKVNVSDMSEVPKPETDLAKFSTKTAIKGNGHAFGAFGNSGTKETPNGWAHYVKDEPEAQPAKVKSDKVSELPKEPKEKKPKDVGQVKSSKKEKKPLTKAEMKAAEARTHSDSMLGPVIPDARTEEEKVQGAAWEMEVGGPEKSERSKDLEKPLETAEQVELRRVKTEWKEARNRSNDLEKQLYGEKQKITGAYEGGQYKQFLENQGWRKFVNVPRKWLGLSPWLPPELSQLETDFKTARGQYFEKSKQLADFREGGTYTKNFEVMKRYQRLLAHRLVVGVSSHRVGIQEKVAIESEKNSRIRPVLETLRKYKWVRLSATAVGYAALAGATGGVGAAALAGGAYGARVLGAMALGGFAGSVQRAIGSKFEKGAVNDLVKGQGDVKADFFSRGFDASETEIDTLTSNIEEIRGLSRSTSAMAAIGYGFVGGSVVDGFYEPLDGGPGTPDTTSPAPNDGSTGSPNLENPAARPESGGGASHLPADNGGGLTPGGGGGPGQPVETTPKLVPNGSSPIEGGMLSGPSPEGGSIGLNGIPDPQLDGVPPDLEAVPESGRIEHKVVPRDNVWNIMEGKGPDANPIGGKSEVLQGTSQAYREAALNKLLEYGEKHPEFGREVGAIRSGGDLSRIWPGETINVSMLDDKLRELLNIEGTTNSSVPGGGESSVVVGEEFYEDAGSDEEPHEPVEEGNGGSTVEYEGADPRAVSFLEELNKLGQHHSEMLDRATPEQRANLADIYAKQIDLKIQNFAASLNPNYVEGLTTPASPADMQKAMDLLGEARGQFADTAFGDGNGQMSAAEMEIASRAFETNPALRVIEQMGGSSYANAGTPVVAPEAGGGGAPATTASFEAANDNGGVEAQSALVDSYVRSVEQPRNGVFDTLFGMGKPNIAGTFEQMQDLSMGELRNMVAEDTLPEGVSDVAFDRWWGEASQVSANDNERFGDVIAKVAANSRAA